MLVVFRHNISHARYNEARALLSNIKNGLRGIMVLLAGCGVGVATGPRAALYQTEVREVAKHLQVRWGCGGLGFGLSAAGLTPCTT
jgi:predicted membrane chloride channel (bestrophin family)